MNCIYSQEHVDFLRYNIIGTSFKDLTEMFNKKFGLELSISAVASLADRHGLHNQRVTLFKGWEPTQFKKGHVPANKGKKGVCAEGCKATWFKKGNKSHNWVPIGSERISKDGYIQIKIQDGKFQHNWRGKHILVWEEHNRPVPKGYAVIFGDRNNRNFNIDNLILVSRQQLLTLNRNDLIQNDADLTRTGVIIADLHKKICDRKKG